MAIQLDGTTGISTTGNIIADGTLTVGSFNPGSINAAGNVAGANLNTAGQLSVGGNAVVTGDLTVVGNASLSGNIVGDKITNGTTSVEIQTPNGNANITIGGTSNVAVFTTAGLAITGTISANGNITGGNLSGTSLTGSVVSASGNITGGNVNTTSVTGSVVSVSGNITSGNVNTTSVTGSVVSVSGNVYTGNISASGAVTATSVNNANANSRLLFTDFGTFSSNIVLFTENANGNVLVRIGESTTEGPGIFGLFATGTIGAIGNLTSQANIAQLGNASSWVLAKNINSEGVISATGNVSGGNINTGGVVSATGNVIGGNLNAAGLSLSSNVVSALNSTSNITTSANVQANYLIGTFVGNISGNITAPGSNTQVVFNDGGNAAGSSTFTFNKTSNVVSVTGNIIGNNIASNTQISAAGNILGNAELYIGAGAASTGLTNPIIVAQATGLAYVQVAAKNSANTGSADLVTYADNGTDAAAWTDMGMTGSGFNDTAYTITNANDGYVFVQGNTDGTGGNLVLATGGLGNTADIVFATGGFLDANEKMRFINATGQFWIETTTNATSATSGALKVSGGAGIAGNIYTGGLISATGNITGGNITGGNANINGVVNVTTSVTVDGGAYGNVVTNQFASVFAHGSGPNPRAIFQARAADGIAGLGMQAYSGLNGQIYSNTGFTFTTGATVRDKDFPTGGTTRLTVDSTGLSATGIVTASGNVTGANILTGGLISATGNITGGNVNTNTIVGTGLTLVSTGNLTLSTTGNINANNEYINNVPTPQQDGDAVNKLYVDGLVTTGFSFHPAVFAATNTTLATATGGTITYTQPNGVANGVGATLTTTGSFNLIDTANIQTIGTRVLVKNEGNAVFNGIYTWANATAIVRSTDADEYGADSTEALSINDYFFVQSGNVNAGSAYVVDAPSGTITFGTSNISFAQFSSAQVYSGNTSAGISLNGTVINALVDNVTTAFSSGNIVVKTGAQLTTPNIGAATGISLSTTGNITGGNINTGGIVSATGNITASYFLGNGSQLTGIDATSIQNGTSNVRVVSSGGNVAVSVGGTSNVAVYATTGEYVTGVISASGNVTAANYLTGGLISSTGNITSAANVAGANVISSGLVTATGNIVTTANVSGGNVLSSALIQGVTLSASGNVNGANIVTAGSVSATGNVIGANFTTVGLISATGNITSAGNIAGGNVLGGANVNATTHTGTTVSITGTVTAATVNAAAIGNSGAAFTGASISAATIGNAAAVVNGATVSITGTVTAASVVGGVMTGSSLSVSGAVTGGAMTGSSLTVSTGAVTLGSIVNANANGVGNIGSSSVYFNTVFGKATTAQYADLAEMYAADAPYAPGTVLDFGGAHEVTLGNSVGSSKIAGVVSTNPAHLMNSVLTAEHPVAVALTGRVPTSVVGTVRKGDMMVSAGNGHAQACATPAIGTVIGKALENFDGQSGVIEVVVGRL